MVFPGTRGICKIFPSFSASSQRLHLMPCFSYFRSLFLYYVFLGLPFSHLSADSSPGLIFLLCLLHFSGCVQFTHICRPQRHVGELIVFCTNYFYFVLFEIVYFFHTLYNCKRASLFTLFLKISNIICISFFILFDGGNILTQSPQTVAAQKQMMDH